MEEDKGKKINTGVAELLTFSSDVKEVSAKTKKAFAELHTTHDLCDRRKVDLQPIQCGPARFMVETKGARGLMCCYQTGFGKTYTAVAIINAMIGAGKVRQALVICPAALVANMREALEKCDGPLTNAASKRTFVLSHETVLSTSNIQSVLESVQNTPTLLVVDESHNFRSPDAPSVIRLNELATKCAAVILLTGTPLFNSTMDIQVQLDIMSRKKQVINASKKDRPATSATEVERRAAGKIAFPTEEAMKALQVRFPQVKVSSVYVHVTEEQTRLLADENKNFNTAGYLKTKDDNETSENFFLMQSRQILVGTHDSSPKLDALKRMLVLSVTSLGEIHALVFTEFLGKKAPLLGAEDIKNRLIECFGKKFKAEVITGEVTMTRRQEIVERFNSHKVHVLILTAAGDEGLTFKNVRQIHLLTPDWSPGRVNQKIGRGVRFESHKALPKDQQNVHVFKYVSKPAKLIGSEVPIMDPTSVRGIMIDRTPHLELTELYMANLEAEKRINISPVLHALQASAIEQTCELKPLPGTVAVAPTGASIPRKRETDGGGGGGAGGGGGGGAGAGAGAGGSGGGSGSTPSTSFSKPSAQALLSAAKPQQVAAVAAPVASSWTARRVNRADEPAASVSDSGQGRASSYASFAGAGAPAPAAWPQAAPAQAMPAPAPAAWPFATAQAAPAQAMPAPAPAAWPFAPAGAGEGAALVSDRGTAAVDGQGRASSYASFAGAGAGAGAALVSDRGTAAVKPLLPDPVPSARQPLLPTAQSFAGQGRASSYANVAGAGAGAGWGQDFGRGLDSGRGRDPRYSGYSYQDSGRGLDDGRDRDPRYSGYSHQDSGRGLDYGRGRFSSQDRPDDPRYSGYSHQDFGRGLDYGRGRDSSQDRYPDDPRYSGYSHQNSGRGQDSGRGRDSGQDRYPDDPRYSFPGRDFRRGQDSGRGRDSSQDRYPRPSDRDRDRDYRD